MAALWTPLDLPALVAWYAADEPLNTVAGGLVSALHDKSGHSNHMTVVGGTAAKRARLFDDALGGRPAWGADGASATAQFSTSGPRLMKSGSGARGLAIIAVTSAVIEHGSTTGGIAMLSRGGNATAGRVQLATGHVANGVFYGAGRRADTDSNLNYNNGSAPTGWVIASASNDYLHRTGELYLDGTQSGRRTDFHTGGHTSTTDSAAAWMGTTSNAAANPYSGKTAEVLFCGDALTDADRQRLEGYLAHKYGKTADLPAGHPYRNAPPMADVYQGLTVPAVSAWAHITEHAPGVRRHALDADTLRRPASMTKFLSTLVARQWVSDALLDTTVTAISADVVGGSTMGLQAGDIVTYRDLFHGLMLPSGNDAAACLGRSVGNLIATAEGGSGGLTRFVAALNARLASLGSSGATFVDASGLSVDNVCTPADMAKVIWAFGADPVLRSIGATMAYTAQVTGANARSLPLAHTAADYVAALPEMQTIKTGTLRPTGANAPKSAGACLGMLWQDASGEDRVTVAFAAASDPARYEDMRRLVDFDVALAALTPPVTPARRRNRLALLVA